MTDRLPSATTRASTLNNFDLLRILAALQVVVGHALTHLHLDRPIWWPVVEAFPGVPIFFVISGFLISTSYERSSSLVSYARNRALRIYPALWVCIALTIVAASFAGISFLDVQAAAWAPAQALGLIYTPVFLQPFGFGSYNGSLWTIPIELQFYLVLPACYALLPSRRAARNIGFLLLLLLFTGLAVAHLLHVGLVVGDQSEPMLHKLFRYSFAPHFYMFLAGVALQRLHTARSRLIAGKGALWIAVYLAFYFTVPRNAWTVVAGALIMGVCVVSVAFTRPGLAESLLRGNDISYGVYIYHGLLINIFLTLGWHRAPALLPLLIGMTVVISFASWRLIERPALGLKRRGRSVNPIRGEAAPPQSADPAPH